MRLTQREIDLLRLVPVERAKRKRNLYLAWAGWLAAPVIAFSLNIDFETGSGADATAIYSMFGGVLIGQWFWYVRSRPEDKLIHVLQRYVNRDPEAIQRLAERAHAEP